MKKCLLLAACLLSGAAVFAQEGVLSSRKAEDGGKVFFNPHWQLQVQAGAAHTVGEAAFKDLLSPAAALSVGYRFTPVWGVRAVLGGWQARGAWVNPLSKYKYNYLQGNVDATLDLGNLFCGYNHRRVFNPYFFAGVGLNGAFNNDEAVALADAGYDLEYLWSGKKISVAGRAGLGVGIRLTERLALNLEVNGNVLTDKFNSKKAGNADWQFNALAGFTIKFGKSSKCVAAPVKREETPVQSPMGP